MSLKSFLTLLVVAGATMLAAPLAGCTGETTVMVRDESPPPHRYERVQYRPGYVFIQGHWQRRGGRHWMWTPGRYERERPGYVYVEGRWRDDGRRHVWVDGQWRRSHTGVVIRDRRY